MDTSLFPSGVLPGFLAASDHETIQATEAPMA